MKEGCSFLSQQMLGMSFEALRPAPLFLLWPWNITM
jgi:hypothetical protein